MDIATGDTSKKAGDQKDSCRLTIWEYTKHVLQKSMVTGLPTIASTHNRARCVFKIMILLFCIVGFCYQTTDFVLYFLTYPSVVDMEIAVRKTAISPAFTFCNNNGLQRTKFCGKYPDRCYVPKDEASFCEEHSTFCDSVKSVRHLMLVPKKKYEEYERTNGTIEEAKELGHALDGIYILNGRYDLSGPYVIKSTFGVPINCYALNLMLNSSMESTPEEIVKKGWDRLIFGFAIDSHEVFHPKRQMGIFFDIHSPYEMGQPVEDGVFLRKGWGYVINIRMEEEYTLPYPYKHNCMDYEKLWQDNGHSGPRSQQVCLEMCHADIELEACNCTTVDGFIHQSEKRCHMDEELQCAVQQERSKRCQDQCTLECKKLKYAFDVQERYAETEFLDPFIQDRFHIQLPSYTYVIIGKTSRRVKVYRHRPQFQSMEVFSYVGGFIGMWLGVSLVAVVDLFEGTASIICFCLKRTFSSEIVVDNGNKFTKDGRRDIFMKQFASCFPERDEKGECGKGTSAFRYKDTVV